MHMERKIYASLVPSVLGKSAYMTPRQAWELITGRREPDKQSLPARAGELLEPLGYELLEASGYRIAERQVSGSTAITDGVALVCRADGIATDSSGNTYHLSIKTTNGRPSLRESYVAQLYAESIALACEHDYIIIVIDRAKLDYETYVVSYEHATANALREQLRQWVVDYVIADTPPPPTTMSEWASHAVEAGSDAVELDLEQGLELLDITLRIKTAEDDVERLKRYREELMQEIAARYPARIYLFSDRKLAQVVAPKPRITYDVDALLRHVPQAVADAARKEVKPSAYYRYYA